MFSLLAFLGGLVFAYVARLFQRFTLAFGLALSGLGLLSWRLQYRIVCQDGVPIGFLEQEAYNKKNSNCLEPTGFVSEKVLNRYEKRFKIGNYE